MNAIQAPVVIPVINYVILFILLALMVCLVAFKWPVMEDTIKSTAESPSQKRLVIFICTLALVMIAFMIVLLNLNCPDMVWYGLLGLIGTGIGATVWEKVKMSNTKPAEEKQ